MTKKKSESEKYSIAEKRIVVSFDFYTKEAASQVADAFAENGYFANCICLGTRRDEPVVWKVFVTNESRGINVNIKECLWADKEETL